MPAALATLGFVSSDFQQSAAHLIPLRTASKHTHASRGRLGRGGDEERDMV